MIAVLFDNLLPMLLSLHIEYQSFRCKTHSTFIFKFSIIMIDNFVDLLAEAEMAWENGQVDAEPSTCFVVLQSSREDFAMHFEHAGDAARKAEELNEKFETEDFFFERVF